MLDQTAGLKLVLSKSYRGRMWLHIFPGFVTSGRPVSTGWEQLFENRQETHGYGTACMQAVQRPALHQLKWDLSHNFRQKLLSLWLLSVLAEEHKHWVLNTTGWLPSTWLAAHPMPVVLMGGLQPSWPWQLANWTYLLMKLFIDAGNNKSQICWTLY